MPETEVEKKKEPKRLTAEAFARLTEAFVWKNPHMLVWKDGRRFVGETIMRVIHRGEDLLPCICPTFEFVRLERKDVPHEARIVVEPKIDDKGNVVGVSLIEAKHLRCLNIPTTGGVLYSSREEDCDWGDVND